MAASGERPLTDSDRAVLSSIFNPETPFSDCDFEDEAHGDGCRKGGKCPKLGASQAVSYAKVTSRCT